MLKKFHGANVLRLRAGDVVEMWGDCQQRYQHSVRVEPCASAAGPRISLVFKRALEAEAALAPAERADGRAPLVCARE